MLCFFRADYVALNSVYMLYIVSLCMWNHLCIPGFIHLVLKYGLLNVLLNCDVLSALI